MKGKGTGNLTKHEKNKGKNVAIKKLQNKIKKLKKKKDGDTIIIPTASGISSFNTSQLPGMTGNIGPPKLG